MRRFRTAILALFAMLALTSCSVPFLDKGEPLPVGTVLDDRGATPGDHVFVNIPTGRIDFTVGSPMDELPIYDDTYGQAADGGSIVRVSWNWDFQSQFESMADERTYAVEPHVNLVADGREYSLDEAMLRSRDENPTDADNLALDFNGTAWVGVAGEPTDFAIRVEFDGVEQEVEVGDLVPVHDTPAMNLYLRPDDLALRNSACAPPTSAGKALEERSDMCLIQSARVPYHPAVGWVSARGDSWVLVRSRVRPNVSLAASYECGAGEVGELTYSLDGDKPVVVERADPDDVVARDTAIFEGDGTGGPNELVMRATMTFPDGDCAPLKLTWRHWVY